MGILPKEGTFLTMKTLRELGQKLEVTQDELIKYDLKSEVIEGSNPPQSKTTWNEKLNDPATKSGVVEVEFEFGLKEDELIRDALKKKNDEKKLTMSEFTLYEKFVEIPEVGETEATRE